MSREPMYARILVPPPLLTKRQHNLKSTTLMPKENQSTSPPPVEDNFDELVLGDTIHYRPFKVDEGMVRDIQRLTSGQNTDIYRKATHLGLKAILRGLKAYATEPVRKTR